MTLSSRGGSDEQRAPAKPATGAPHGRDRQKGRTRAALLAAAIRLIAEGRTPSVADVADAAEVSRRTAYRYFATQEQLLVEAALEGTRPSIERAIEGPAPSVTDDASDDVEARLDRAVRTIHSGAVANEALLRTMIRLTVGPHEARDAVPGTEGPDAPRPRGYRRIEWIELALAPARQRLGKRRYARLVAALTVCLGIDALIVLRDLCGYTPEEAEAVTRWAAAALLREALGEVEDRSDGPPARAPRRATGRSSG
jgi:AcrR family transcriptional regulator